MPPAHRNFEMVKYAMIKGGYLMIKKWHVMCYGESQGANLGRSGSEKIVIFRDTYGENINWNIPDSRRCNQISQRSDA
jgi:hypothetical protein